MRLICPNCGAQYEVADDVIPPEGRDVQCSSCGHTWFENHGASSIEDAFADIQDPVVEPDADDASQSWTASDFEQDPEPASVAAPAPARQELDPAIADILREEAAREAEARKREAQTAIETQPDLDLSQVPPAAPTPQETEAQTRMARLKGEEAAAVAAAASARRELLPDIEEINSSLRSNSERSDAAPATEADIAEKKSSGFRRAFFTVLAVLAVAFLLYLYADQISEAVPAAAPALDSYVMQVDALRFWLDAQLQLLLAMIDGSTAL